MCAYYNVFNTNSFFIIFFTYFCILYCLFNNVCSIYLLCNNKIYEKIYKNKTDITVLTY